MMCPDCGEKLHGIAPLSEEEWICANCGVEYYGIKQSTINKQKRRGSAEK